VKRWFQKAEGEEVDVKKKLHCDDLMEELNHCQEGLREVSYWVEYLEELVETAQELPPENKYNIEAMLGVKAELLRYLEDITGWVIDSSCENYLDMMKVSR
jgi:hypothetical protein